VSPDHRDSSELKIRAPIAASVRENARAAFLSRWERLGLADVSLEEGRLGSLEAAAREAMEVFRKQQSIDEEVRAHILLARALLMEGKLQEATAEINQAKALWDTTATSEILREGDFIDRDAMATSNTGRYPVSSLTFESGNCRRQPTGTRVRPILI